MLPSLVSLQYFERAAESLSFRHAAATVGVSPAAFGERIRHLEEHVGYPLFSRGARSAALTPEGRLFLPRVQRALDEIRKCIETTEVDAAAPLDLTLGTPYELGLAWVVPMLSLLESVRPQRTIHLAFVHDNDLLARVRYGRIDCALSSARIEMFNLRYQPLRVERYVLLTSPGVVARRKFTRAEDARDHRILDLRPGLPLFRHFLEARPAGEPWDFGSLEYLGEVGAVRHRLLDGAGIAVLPRRLVERELARGDLVELMPETKLAPEPIGLIWRVSHPCDMEIRQLAAELRQFSTAVSTLGDSGNRAVAGGM
jgi:DNA-binding transcriptional LysR family regulator